VAWAARVFGLHGQPNVWERDNWDQAIAVCLNLGVGTGWFCLTRCFYHRSSASYQAAVDAFSRNIERPVDYAHEEGAVATDDLQSRLIGWLCLPYGAVLVLLALIPNPPAGRSASP
jgi:hypothetical protein